MFRYIIFSFLLVFLLLFSSGAHASAVIIGARIGDKPDNKTRFVVDIADLGKYQVFTLENPDRIVIDIDSGKINSSGRDIEKLSGAVIKSVRYGKPSSGKLRIVLDLHFPVSIQQNFIIDPKSQNETHRLVLDIKKSSRAIFSRDAGAPPSSVIEQETPAAESNRVSTESSKAPASMRKPKRNYNKKKTDVKAPASMQKPEEKPSPQKVELVDEIVAPKPIVKPSSLEKQKKRTGKPVIVIDAGHGGIDPGSIGRSGMQEKLITMKYAASLQKQLEKTGKFKAVLTRKGDYYVNLRDRVVIAREAKGDLFISLHADSHPNPKTRGLSVYTLSEQASDREAANLAEKANREDVLEGVDLKNENVDLQTLLIDMVQRDTKNKSAEFAELMVASLGKEAKLLKNSHRFAGFVVLTGADVPSVLVELGYMSNRVEEKLLRTDSYRENIVAAITKAVDKYFEGNSY